MGGVFAVSCGGKVKNHFYHLILNNFTHRV